MTLTLILTQWLVALVDCMMHIRLYQPRHDSIVAVMRRMFNAQPLLHVVKLKRGCHQAHCDEMTFPLVADITRQAAAKMQ